MRARLSLLLGMALLSSVSCETETSKPKPPSRNLQACLFLPWCRHMLAVMLVCVLHKSSWRELLTADGHTPPQRLDAAIMLVQDEAMRDLLTSISARANSVSAPVGAHLPQIPSLGLRAGLALLALLACISIILYVSFDPHTWLARPPVHSYRLECAFIPEFERLRAPTSVCTPAYLSAYISYV